MHFSKKIKPQIKQISDLEAPAKAFFLHLRLFAKALVMTTALLTGG
jgi:hypothetical protein